MYLFFFLICRNKLISSKVMKFKTNRRGRALKYYKNHQNFLFYRLSAHESNSAVGSVLLCSVPHLWTDEKDKNLKLFRISYKTKWNSWTQNTSTVKNKDQNQHFISQLKLRCKLYFEGPVCSYHTQTVLICIILSFPEIYWQRKQKACITEGLWDIMLLIILSIYLLNDESAYLCESFYWRYIGTLKLVPSSYKAINVHKAKGSK